MHSLQIPPSGARSVVCSICQDLDARFRD
ncbi:MAG: hypothetical protein F4Y80_16805 [Caldilineaceae bacterium SB0665_bin_21]|nr:hypothetical protein [Caldilineaceae bacterium SB0665_bin_21]